MSFILARCSEDARKRKRSRGLIGEITCPTQIAI